MNSLTYDFTQIQIRKGSETLSAEIKPDFSFTYDAINYNSAGLRKYRVGDTESDLTAAQATEIEAYITSVTADPVAQVNFVSTQYLAETDWYVTRFAETGVAVPSDITTARAAARANVVAGGG